MFRKVRQVHGVVVLLDEFLRIKIWIGIVCSMTTAYGFGTHAGVIVETKHQYCVALVAFLLEHRFRILGKAARQIGAIDSTAFRCVNRREVVDMAVVFTEDGGDQLGVVALVAF